jgi:hypothetical protein
MFAKLNIHSICHSFQNSPGAMFNLTSFLAGTVSNRTMGYQLRDEPVLYLYMDIGEYGTDFVGSPKSFGF